MLIDNVDDVILNDALTTNNALTSLIGRNGSTGVIEERTVASITGIPGGSDTQVQFNNSGAFGGDADFTFTGGNTLNITNAATGTLSITQGAIISGTFAATSTAVSNVSATSVNQTFYSRVGNVVTYSGNVSITPTNLATPTIVSITIPIASNFTTNVQAAGTLSSQIGTGNTTNQGYVESEQTNDVIELNFEALNTGNQSYWFTCQYIVL